jgi:transcriptional regulator of acetoin/glycerol metabolism
MFNNMYLVNDGAFRQANYYNQLYRDTNPDIAIPALTDRSGQNGAINNDAPSIIPQANSSNLSQ